MGFDGVAGLPRQRWRFLVRLVVSGLAVVGADAARASQPAAVDCPATSFVGSEVEFNDALRCYNSTATAAPYTITLTAPIPSTTGWPTPTGTAAFVPVTQSGAGFSLRIDGNNHQIDGFVGVTDGLLYLDADAPITLNEIRAGFGASTYAQAVILARGDLTMIGSSVAATSPVEGGALHVRGGTAAISDSSFANGRYDVPFNIPVSGVLVDAGTISFTESDGSLIMTDGVADVVNSSVDVQTRGGVVFVEQSHVGDVWAQGGATIVRASDVDGRVSVNGGVVVIERSFVQSPGSSGISVGGGLLVLADSTVAGHSVNEIRVDGGNVSVLNSTLTGTRGTSTGNSGSIYVTSGAVTVANSTIANDPYEGNDVEGINSAGGTVRVISSIVNGCSGNPVVDDGHNVGSCFGGATIDLRELTDNGCAAGFGLGERPPCVPVRPPREGSPALGAGTCTGVPVYDRATVTVATGDLATDQRGAGFGRTPAGATGCDAGAVEGLSDILECVDTEYTVATEQHFNDAIGCYNASPITASFRIMLAADIASTMSWPFGSAFTTAFRPISGGGSTASGLDIDGQGHSLIGQPAPTTFGLAVSSPSDQPVLLRNLTLSGSSTAMFLSNSARVTVWRSTITGNHDGVAAFVQNDLRLINSSVTGNTGAGVLGGQGSRLTIANSTIRDNGSGGVQALNATTIITNSTLSDNGGPGLVVTGGRPATLMNSTVTGNAGAGVVVFEGAVTIASSTVADNPDLDVAVADGASVTLVSSLVNACGGAMVDGGHNAGSCFGAAAVVPAPLGNNGCSVPAGVASDASCTATMALPAGSAAIGAGTCTAVPVYHAPTGSVATGDRPWDQRGPGYPRTPAGAQGCDAGAFEAP